MLDTSTCYEHLFDLDTELRGSFIDQAAEIWQSVRLGAQHIDRSKILFFDVRRFLKKIWPDCRVKIFGSVETGLAFISSDMDFFVELPVHCGEHPVQCLLRIRNRVVCDTTFDFVSWAPHARVPVITLSHRETGRRCDITFSGSIAVHTSKLLKYLLRVDPRAFKLAVLVKFWSNIYKLTPRLSKYTITLLLVFYLQRKKVLPSVATLQNNGQIDITDGWNTAFAATTYESNNAESLYQLLGEFFMYYRSFNFEDFVICPYLAHPVKRQTFLNCNRLPPEFKLYKEQVRRTGKSLELNSPWVVQDPVEHTRNCVELNDPLAIWKVQRCFEVAAISFMSCSSFEFLRCLISRARGVSPARSLINAFPQHPLTDGQVPRTGRSWKYYFCISFCLFIFYTFWIQ